MKTVFFFEFKTKKQSVKYVKVVFNFGDNFSISSKYDCDILVGSLNAYRYYRNEDSISNIVEEIIEAVNEMIKE